MGHQEPHGHVESQRLNKCWKPGTFLFLENELISLGYSRKNPNERGGRGGGGGGGVEDILF